MSLLVKDIKHMKVVELRSELKVRGVNSNGLKRELVSRLLANRHVNIESKCIQKRKLKSTKTKTEYKFNVGSSSRKIPRTKEEMNFPALGTSEVNEYLEKFAMIPSNCVVLPYNQFRYLLSPKVKNQHGYFRNPQRFTFPSTPEEVSEIRKMIQNKQHILISINFTSLYDNLAGQTNHVVVLHVDVLNNKIKYFDSNLMEIDLKPKAENKEKNRFKVVQRNIHAILRTYGLVAEFEIKPVFAKYGSKPGMTKNCTVFLFCLLDQLFDGKETEFPKLSASRVKCGEVMKALVIGTPNFLLEEEMEKWKVLKWGKAAPRT